MIYSTGASDKTEKLGITLPKSIVQKIDKERGDIPRSRYILRAIENYLSSSTATTKIKKRK
jgi:metal-responsive CopG/Arc/MetJ family transcriptional regulator